MCLPLSKINDHEALPGVDLEAPSSLGTGFANREPFEEATCAQAFSADTWTYRCSNNFCQLDMAQLNTPSVPNLRSSIEGLMRHYFTTCAPLPQNMVGRASSAQHAASDASGYKVVAVSPLELVFAYIFAVQRDLSKGDDGLLVARRRTMLACPIEFHMRGSPEERHKIALQYRENLAENYATMRYTAVQKMYDVKRTMDEIAKREPVTVEAVTAYYASVRCSSAGENISK